MTSVAHATEPDENLRPDRIPAMQNRNFLPVISPSRTFSFLAGMLIAAVAFVAIPVYAAQDSGTPAVKGEWYTVKGSNVNVRCEPNVSGSYSMGKLQKGSPVLVSSEANMWATIRTIGPAFKTIYGLLIKDNRVTTNNDKVEVLSATDLMAPNVPSENNPARSWKRLVKLAPGTTLKVHETFSTGNQNFMLVSLPMNAQVFMNMAFLQKASPEESTALTTRYLAQAKPANPVVATSETTPEPSSPEGDLPATSADTTTVVNAEITEETIAVVAENDAVVPAEITTPARPLDPAPVVVAVPEVTTTTTTVVVANTDGETEEVTVKTSEIELVEDPMATITLKQAEAAWEAIKNEDPDESEIEDLQLIYMAIATRDTSDETTKRIAELRIRQLELQRQVKERLRRLESVKSRNTADKTRMNNAQVLIEARSAYDAVGRLNASRIYDGKRLPQLYRLQAPAGGRTIGYIRPSESLDMIPMLGRLVGIVGSKDYDAGYRLLIITPKRLDILPSGKESK